MTIPPIQSSVTDTGDNLASAANDLLQDIGKIDKSVSNEGVSNQTIMVIAVAAALAAVIIMRGK